MVTIHPSLTLILDLQEELCTQDAKLEIARCYSHIGTPIVHSHESSDETKPGNIARFIVSMGTKQYLYSKDEGAGNLFSKQVLIVFIRA